MRGELVQRAGHEGNVGRIVVADGDRCCSATSRAAQYTSSGSAVLKGHTVELSPTAPSSTDVVASFDAGEADARVTEDLGEPGGDVVDDLSRRRASARGNVAT